MNKNHQTLGHGFPSLRVALCVAAAIGGSFVSAQNDSPLEPRAAPPAADVRAVLKSVERDFAEKIVRMGTDATAISEVAVERTLNPRVKIFAEKLGAEHGRVTAELAALASGKGVVLPAKDNVADKWAKRDATDFDADYLKKIVADHKEAVKLFQKQARDGEDAELVAFARKHLPSIEQHLEQAVDLQKSMQ